MPPEVVGTAYVRIRAITTQLAGDITDGVNKGAADANPDVDVSGQKVGKKFGSGIAEGVTQAQDTITDAVDDVIKETTNNGRGSDKDRNFFSRFGASLSRMLHRSFRDENDEQSKTTHNNFLKSFKKLGNSLAKIKLPKTVWLGVFGLPAIVGAAKTAVFYITGLVARLGTLVEATVGASAVIGFAFAEAVLAVGLLAAAFKADTPELTAFQAKMKVLGAEWKTVAQETQRGLFPGLEEAARTLTSTLVPGMRELGRYVGESAGNSAVLIANLLKSEQGVESFGDISHSTGIIMDDIGRLGVALVRIILPMTDKLAELANRFSNSIATAAERWADIVESDTGRLNDFLESSYQSAERIARALGDVFIGLWNILRIGSDVSGLAALDRFEDFAQRFRDFTESASGENKIRKFFKEAEPVIREVNGIVADLVVMLFGSIESGTGSDNIVSVLQKLRYEVIPILAKGIKDIADSVSGATGEDFLNVVTALLKAFVEAEIAIPTMQVMTKLLEILAYVLNIPVVGDIVGVLLALGAAFRFLRAVGAVALLKGLGKGINFLSEALLGVGTGTAFKAFLSGLLGSDVPIAGLAGSFQSLGAAIAGIALPVTIIVGVIGALYFAFQPVRDLVDELWQNFVKLFDAIKKGDILGALKQIGTIALKTLWFPFLLGFAVIRGIWDKIKGVIGELPGIIADAVGAIPEKLGGIVDFFESLWTDTIWPFLQSLPGRIGEALASAASSLWGWVSEGAVQLGIALASLWTDTIWPFLTSLPGKILSAITSLPGTLWSWIQTAIPQIAYWLGYALGFIVGMLIGLPIRIGTLMVQAGIALWTWISEALPVALFWLGNLALNVLTWVIGFVASIPGWIFGAISAITQWILDAVPVALNWLGNMERDVLSWVINFVASIPGWIVGAIGAITDWITTAATEAPGKLAELATQIFDWARALPGQIIEAFGDIAGMFWDIGVDIVQGIIDGVGSMGGVLKDAAGGLVSGFADAVGLGFLTGSPSKLMMKYGRWAVEGFGVGVEQQVVKGKSKIDAAINDLVGNTTRSASFDYRVNGVTNPSEAKLGQIAQILAETSAPTLHVYIGDKELTELVDVRVDEHASTAGRAATVRLG